MSSQKIINRLISNESTYKDSLEWRNLYGSLKFIFRNLIGIIISKKPSNNNLNKYLNLGCGAIYIDNWTNADFYRFRKIKLDWMLDIGKKWKCDSNFWDGIFSEHTLEHLTYEASITCFKECHRTLKTGGILRLSIPNIDLYIEHLSGKFQHKEFEQFPTKAESISYVTQNFGHKSTWNPELLISLLNEIGFKEVKQMEFFKSFNQDLCIEQEYKEWETMYIEAIK